MSEVAGDVEGVIRVMPETLANKIAAGEVVQRPASVAKELIENAVDAGAEDVELILKKSGRELVQVIDDGCGMSRADAVACFKRHATSKIQSVEDLERIRTLGFRGEALASIGAVAQVELKTKRVEDAVGTHVRVDGGKIVETEPCAAPNGTSVAVRNLFFNVPARRNFLKTPATEFKHLAETFQFLSLSEPSIAFGLVHNGNEVYRLPAAAEGNFFDRLSRRIGDLFGEAHARKLVQVEDESSYLSARGFVGEPEFHRRGRDEQFLFVNGRHVESRYLAHAVRAAYDNLLPEGTFPFFTLFLELDPRRVDVNVHPTKAEVKFDDQSGVYGFVKSVVRRALGAQDLTPQFEAHRREAEEDSEEEKPTFSPKGGQRPVSFQPRWEGEGAEGKASAASRPQKGGSSAEKESSAPASGGFSETLYRPRQASSAEDASEEAPQTESERKQVRLPFWQLEEQYVVTVREGRLFVIDQAAAHRRILYERARRRLEEKGAESQQLLFPHTLEFSAADFELLQELLPDLGALGFDLEPFSGRTVVVRGVPPELRVGEERTSLEALLEQYKANQDQLQLKKRENLAQSLARQGAIRKGHRLSVAEMKALARDLFRCEMPYADPQGRPTVLQLAADELGERFGQ